MTLAYVARDVDLPADQVRGWVQNERISLSLLLCVATAIIYDILITMDKEVKYFWGKKLILPNIVFFLVGNVKKWKVQQAYSNKNRYIGVVGAVMDFAGNIQNTTLALCSASPWVSDFSFAITIIAIDYILTIRVLALYCNGILITCSLVKTLMFTCQATDRKISILIYTLLALEATGKFLITVLGTRLEPAVTVKLFPHLNFCGYNSDVPPFMYIVDWTIPLAYGTLLLCLALWKGREFWKDQGLTGTRLVVVLLRDQALYFLLVIFSSVVAIMGNKFASKPIVSGILDTLGAPTFLCILGNRMFFNLKEAAEHGVNVGTNWASYSCSAMHFIEQEGLQQEGGSVSPEVVDGREGGSDAA